jgi:enoyl-CoA hydratase
MQAIRTETQPQTIELSYEGEIALLTLNRPHRRNALTKEIRVALAKILQDLGEDGHVRGLVFASRESSFSSGQDLAEAKEFPVEYIARWIEEHMDLYRALLSFPKPLLAAVDGCCVGAGLQTAMLCDLRIGTPESFFAMPELDDAIPCILGVWTLYDVIGRGRTTEMVLTNRQIGAQEALSWGILNRIVPAADLLGATVELARQLAAKPPLAMRLTKERLRDLALAEAEALTVHAQYAHTIAFASGEPRRAMQDFLEKRRTVRS